MRVKPKPVTFEIAACDLARGMHNALLFEVGDRCLPVLNAVHIDGGPNGLRFVATDRFTLGEHTIQGAFPKFQMTIKADDCRLLLRLFPMSSKRPGLLDVTVTSDSIGFEPSAAALDLGIAPVKVALSPVEGEFPDWEKLFEPKLTDYDAGAVVGVNPRYIAKFARVKYDGSDRTPLKMRVHSATKAIYLALGDDFRGLIMPVRLEAAASVTPVKRSAA